MAQIIQNKFPIDSNARKAVGFGFPLNGDAVFVPTYQTRDQIRANLINYLLTNKGERVFNPNFGADLRALLFENVNNFTLDTLQSTIESYIALTFPEISIKEVKFDPQPDDNTINFSLTYEIVLFGIEDTIDILLQ